MFRGRAGHFTPKCAGQTFQKQAYPLGHCERNWSLSALQKGQVLGIATKYREEKEKPNVSSVTTEETKQTNSPSDVLSTFNLDHVPTDKREPLEKLLKKNIDLFVQKDCELTSTNVTEMRINTQDHPPICQAPRRPPLSHRPALEEQSTRNAKS